MPVPPVLVGILRDHLDRYGTEPEGRLFRSPNGGVPATEVAERAGHSVDVLLKVYAKCIDGRRDTVNRRIEALYEEE